MFVLTLLHVHKVVRQIVNIHQHIVTQELITGCGIEFNYSSRVFQCQSRIEHVSAIVSLSVGGRIGRFIVICIQQSVRETVLSNILIVGHIV